MGELAKTAQRNSNFLMLEKGSSIVAKYKGYKVAPNQKDPTKEVVIYEFEVEGQRKFWTNGNSKIMLIFDELKFGTCVRISRNPWINKDGGEDTTKSSYAVDVIPAEDPASW